MGNKNREELRIINNAMKVKLSVLQEKLIKLKKRQEMGDNTIELVREINITVNNIEVTTNRMNGDFIDRHEGNIINLNELKR